MAESDECERECTFNMHHSMDVKVANDDVLGCMGWDGMYTSMVWYGMHACMVWYGMVWYACIVW